MRRFAAVRAAKPILEKINPSARNRMTSAMPCVIQLCLAGAVHRGEERAISALLAG
jgi:hypothetical protein